MPCCLPNGKKKKKELERQGKYVYDKEFGWVTPTIEVRFVYMVL
jgi:hypothetical protein